MCFVVFTGEVCHSYSSEAVIALLLNVWKLRLSEHWTIKQEVKIPTLCGRFHSFTRCNSRQKMYNEGLFHARL